jgi:hypothetical protein
VVQVYQPNRRKIQDKLGPFSHSRQREITRHLTPTLSPNSVGGEGEKIRRLSKNLRRDWPDGHLQNQNSW